MHSRTGGRAHVFGTDLPAHPDVVGLATWGAAVLLLGTAAALLTQVGALRAQAAAAAGTRGYMAGVLAEVTRLAASASEHQPPAERFPPAAAADRSILIRAFVRDSAVLVRSLSFTLGASFSRSSRSLSQRPSSPGSISGSPSASPCRWRCWVCRTWL